MKYTFSIIIPVLHESGNINAQLGLLLSLATKEPYEVIIVDGDPHADTIQAVHHKNKVVCLKSPPGRALQMNLGAKHAQGDILLFLHADTELPANALDRILSVLRKGPYVGGAFDLGIQSKNLLLRLIALVASWRSRLTRIPYGDQAIFMKKDFFLSLGGFKDLPLMEDVDLMRRVKKSGGKICILSDRVITSARRWENEGIVSCTLRNWIIITLYFLGVSPQRLSKFYPQRRNYN